MSRSRRGINPLWAERLKTILKEQKITQGELSVRIFLSQQQISKIKTGKAALTPAVAESICKEFPQYRVDWLLGYDDFKNDDDCWRNSIIHDKEPLLCLAEVLALAGYELQESEERTPYEPPLSRKNTIDTGALDKQITHPVSYDVITMDDKWLEALDKWDSMTEAPEIPPACFAGKITYDQALELATKIRDYSRWQMQILLGEWEYTPLE